MFSFKRRCCTWQLVFVNSASRTSAHEPVLGPQPHLSELQCNQLNVYTYNSICLFSSLLKGSWDVMGVGGLSYCVLLPHLCWFTDDKQIGPQMCCSHVTL